MSLSLSLSMGISVVFSRGMDESWDCGERERERGGLCIYPLVGSGVGTGQGLCVSWPRALEHHIISCFSSLPLRSTIHLTMPAESVY
jgi:hypothetical protein